jgi:acetylornithine deacetylase/succinyl-diaminopimelate desuccinylase-like protein
VCEVECVRRNPPLATDEDSPLVAAVKRAQRECGLEPAVGTKATCTEAGLLSSQGLDAVVIGAGTSVGNVHRPNEHTRISELERMRALYARTIETLCCGEGA